MNLFENNTIKIEQNGMLTMRIPTEAPVIVLIVYNDNNVNLNLNGLQTNQKYNLFKDTSNSPSVSGVGKSIRPLFIPNETTNFLTNYKIEDKAENGLKQEIDSPEKYICNVCNQKFECLNDLVRHKLVHEDSKKFMCEDCSRKFTYENHLRNHQERYCKNGSRISTFCGRDLTVWKCKKCNEVLSSQLDAYDHVALCLNLNIEVKIEKSDKDSLANEKENSKEAIYNKNIEKTLTKFVILCEFCNRAYVETKALIMHQRTHTTAKNYECVNCLQIFDSYSAAAQHWMKNCSEDGSHFSVPQVRYCEHCDRVFGSYKLLYEHKRRTKHYTSKLFEPDIDIDDIFMKNDDEMDMESFVLNSIKMLDDTFNEFNFENTEEKEENVDEGNRDNTENFKYQCESCIEIFTNVNDLGQHRMKCHSSKSNSAVVGQGESSRKAKMLKQNVCETCGRCYLRRYHLVQHKKRIHQVFETLACTYEDCKAKFDSYEDLGSHVRTVHTRKRPYKCSICQQCFSCRSVYYHHRQLHTKNKKFACNLCSKRFYRCYNLREHQRTHTGERPFSCEFCKTAFRQRGNLLRHRKTQHPR